MSEIFNQTKNHEPYLNQFINLLVDWDITYQYSDDHRTWKTGHDHFTKMLGVFNKLNQLDKETAKRIANLHVDNNIVETQRDQYYWK